MPSRASNWPDAPWRGMRFVIAGQLHNLTHRQIQDAIAARGGQTERTITRQTSMLVYGRQAGSMLTKARNRGVRIMDEQDFRQALSKPRLLLTH